MLSCSNKHGSAVSYWEKAYLLENRGDYKNAIKYLNKAIELDPYFVNAYLDRGVDYSLLGNYEKAIIDYGKVIEIDSTNCLAYYNRAKNNYRVNKFNEALDDINKAYQLAVKASYVVNGIGNLLLENKNDEYAVPLNDIFFERSTIYLELDSLDYAYRDINQAMKSHELFNKGLYWRGKIYIKMDSIDEACQDFQLANQYGIIDAQIEIMKYCR